MCEILSLTTLCRCCHADGNFKSLKMSYCVDNCVEVYSEMLENTLGIYVQSASVEASYTICDNCIEQLRNATKFKKQVEECEKKFGEYCKNELLQQMDIKLEKEVENDFIINPEMVVKTEVEETYTDDDNDNQHYESMEPETVAIEFIPNRVIETSKQEKAINKREKVRGKPREKQSISKAIRFTRKKTENGFRYTCKLCNNSFLGYNQLKRHLDNSHTREFTCITCNQKFTSYPLYSEHVATHGKKRFKCTYCDKNYATKNDLKNHRNWHTKERLFICDICQKEYLFRDSLRKHILWHMGLNKKFVCDTCGRTFNDSSNFRIHNSTVHEKIRPYKCELCPRAFAAKKNYKLHMQTHTGDYRYRCDVCQKGFICSSYLTRHKLAHEKGGSDGKYVCKICYTGFNHRGDYMAHVRKHTREKPYSCDLCGKSFVTNYTLGRHKEIHSGTAKRYKCDLCNKTLSTNSLLKRHIVSVHDPSRESREKVACKICKISVYNMEKHMQNHSFRPFKCHLCDKTYREKNALNRHIKSHDGEKFPCDICGKLYVRKSGLKRHMLKSHEFIVKTDMDFEDN